MSAVRDVQVTPALPAALIVPLADVKAFLGITDGAQDATVTAQIQTATQAIEEYCRTFFAARNVVETMHGEDPNETLVLSHAPASGLSAVAIDGEAGNTADYSIIGATGMLRRVDGGAICATKFAVTYSAGYATAPPLVTQAVKEFVKAIREAASRPAGVASESVPDVGSVSYDASGSYGAHGVPVTAAALLGPFVRRYS